MTSVTTDKKRVSLYVDEEVKEKLERLAKARKRSLSNLIEVSMTEIVEKAEKEGEI